MVVAAISVQMRRTPYIVSYMEAWISHDLIVLVVITSVVVVIVVTVAGRVSVVSGIIGS